MARDDITTEEGWASAKASSAYCATILESMSVGISIDDYGVPMMGSQKNASATQANDGSRRVSAYVTQQVPYVRLVPPDYHGIGSRIEWTATYQVVEKSGHVQTGCLRLRAFIPGKIRDARC